MIQQLSAERIANALDKPRRIGADRYLACCPAHDDNSPSFSITQKADRVLFYCFTGCSQDEVIDALRSRGLWPEKGRAPGKRGFTTDQIEYMEIWLAVYRDNIAKDHKPTAEETSKQQRYTRAMERING